MATKGYLIFICDIRDRDTYVNVYAAAGKPLVPKHGGQTLIKWGRNDIVEGDWRPPSICIVEFDSYDKARAYFFSDDYTAARKLREQAADVQCLVVEGLQFDDAVHTRRRETLAPEGTAPRGYLVFTVDITDSDRYVGQYAATAKPIVPTYGGLTLINKGRQETIEGSWSPASIVLIEFESYEAAETFYHSPEYTAARQLRAGAAHLDCVIVEGL